MADHDFHFSVGFTATNFQRASGDGDLNTKPDRQTYVSAYWDYNQGAGLWQFHFHFQELHKDYTILKWSSPEYYFVTGDGLEFYVDSDPRPGLADLPDWSNGYGFGKTIRGELHDALHFDLPEGGFRNLYMIVDGSGSDEKNALVVGVAYPHFKVRVTDRPNRIHFDQPNFGSAAVKVRFDEALAKIRLKKPA